MPVIEEDAVFAINLRPYLFYVLEVDDRGAMDAQECAGVELLFEVGHRLTQEVSLALGADADVVFFSRDPANVRDGKEDDSSARLEDDASGVVTCGLTGGTVAGRLLVGGEDLFARSLHGRREALLGEWLDRKSVV